MSTGFIKMIFLLYDRVSELHQGIAGLNAQQNFIHLLKYANGELEKYLDKAYDKRKLYLYE